MPPFCCKVEVVGLEGEFCTSDHWTPAAEDADRFGTGIQETQKRRLRMGNVTGGGIGGSVAVTSCLTPLPTLRGLAGGSRL